MSNVVLSLLENVERHAKQGRKTVEGEYGCSPAYDSFTAILDDIERIKVLTQSNS